MSDFRDAIESALRQSWMNGREGQDPIAAEADDIPAMPEMVAVRNALYRLRYATTVDRVLPESWWTDLPPAIREWVTA